MTAETSQFFTQSPAVKTTGQQLQNQKLSARMLHSVKILESSSAELESMLQELVNTNPLLELSGTSDPLALEESAGKLYKTPDENKDPFAAEEPFATPEKEEDYKEDRDFFLSSAENSSSIQNREKEWDEYLEGIWQETPEEWENDLSFREETPFYDHDQNKASSGKKDYFFDSLTSQESLKDFLMEQLRFSDAPEKIRKGAEYIIGSLENNGFFTDPLTDIAQMADVTLPDAEKALMLVQSFDPPGVGAVDLSQCLLLQLKRKKIKNPLLEKLIREHLEDTARNRLPHIASAMKISMEKLGTLLEELRKLEPRPAGRFALSQANSIIPDVIVEENDDGDFKVILNDRRNPKLYFSHTYDPVMNDPALSAEDKNYFKEKTAEGKRAIYELEHRSSTILRIAQLIVSEQYEFMKHGGTTLKPFTMHQAADKLGVDDSTVSRGCNQKYMLTPRGVFEFKYFFTTGYTASTGEETSRISIMEMLREMIACEDPFKPLSDDTLSRMLREKGYDVARRTVMKYRESMNIASSQGRRKHL